MYVCVFVCMYVCMYVCVCVRACVCVCVCECVCMDGWMDVLEIGLRLKVVRNGKQENIWSKLWKADILRERKKCP